MRRILRENALCAFMASGGCAAMAWLGLYGFAWNDYEIEARPAFAALVHGHVAGFLRLVPAYGGSLIERAPFALLPGLWGGGPLAVYRAVAIPCLLAAAVLGVWLCARMRTEGRSALARAVAVGICVANPLTLSALELGHPEEVLGACLCVAAVVLAGRNRPVWAGVTLGLAIANKEWALLALGPVLLALEPRAPAADGRTSPPAPAAGPWSAPAPGAPAPDDSGRPPATPRRGLTRAAGPLVACVASTGIVSALILGPLALVSAGGFVASARLAAVPGGTLFQPWQLWWFFGSHGALVHGAFGIPLHGYRVSPTWTGTISHPLIIATGFALAAALWLKRRRGQRAIGERGAMLALALVLLLRCVLDTWNTGYYMLPFLIALLAWEVRGANRPPALVLVGVVLPWLALQELSADGLSPDAQAALFLAWTLPLAAWLGLRVFCAERPAHGAGVAYAPGAGAQETTVSALGRLVSSS